MNPGLLSVDEALAQLLAGAAGGAAGLVLGEYVLIRFQGGPVGCACSWAVLGLARRDRSPFWWLLATSTLIGLFSTAAFFVVARYRIPWTPGLALLAGAGLVDLAEVSHRASVKLDAEPARRAGEGGGHAEDYIFRARSPDGKHAQDEDRAPASPPLQRRGHADQPQRPPRARKKRRRAASVLCATGLSVSFVLSR